MRAIYKIIFGNKKDETKKFPEFLKKILGLHLDPEEKRVLDAITKSGLKTMRVVGRGTLVVDPAEVSSTTKFKEYSEQAKKLVNQNN